MLSFPDSNSFSDHENTFKYTFKYSPPHSGPAMDSSATHASNRRKIPPIPGVSASDPSSSSLNCPSSTSLRRWQSSWSSRPSPPQITRNWQAYSWTSVSKSANGPILVPEPPTSCLSCSTSWKSRSRTICTPRKSPTAYTDEKWRKHSCRLNSPSPTRSSTSKIS